MGTGRAWLLLDRWNGDLRRLRHEADGAPRRMRDLLCEFKGIGPAGADIYLREVQAVWPEVSPYVDDRVSAGAKLLGLPSSARGLSGLAESPAELARLASALVGIAGRSRLADEIKAEAGRSRSG